MTDLLELRCPTCHKLLGKVSGSNFELELKCRECKEIVTARRPHPLQPKRSIDSQPK